MQRRWRIGLALLMVGLPVLVFWPGLAGGLIFDDYPNLVDDPSWQVHSLEWSQWLGAALGGISSAIGRPLAMLSFAANHYLFGLDVWWLKAVSLGWHGLNTLLLYLVLVQCLQLAKCAPRIGVPAAAGMAALAWALHPLQVSTVLYVVQRMELGAATGVLLSLWCYLIGRRAGLAGRPVYGWALGAVLAVIAGVGFKETALLVPVYTLLLEVCLLHFRGRDGRFLNGLAGLYALGFIFAAVAYLAWIVPRYGFVPRYPGRDFGTWERLLSQGPVLWGYLTQALSAWPEFLRFYYDDLPAWLQQARWWQLLLPWLGLIGILLSAVALRRRAPLYALGVGWFFAGHLLTSNIWPLELAFEHRNYFPLAGLALAACAICLAVGRRFTAGTGPTIALVFLGYMGGMGALQAGTWGSEDRLVLTLANRAESSERAAYSLAKWMYGRADGDVTSPLWSLSAAEFERASALPLSSALPEQALIIMKARASLPVEQGLWDRLVAKISRRELDAQTLSAVEGLVQCATSGECHFIDERPLQALLIAAIDRSPGSARLWARYGEFSVARMGDNELALELFRKAIALAPDEPVFRLLLARTLLSVDQPAALTEVAQLLAWTDSHDTRDEHAAERARLRALLEFKQGGDHGAEGIYAD